MQLEVKGQVQQSVLSLFYMECNDQTLVKGLDSKHLDSRDHPAALKDLGTSTPLHFLYNVSMWVYFYSLNR